MSNRVNNSGPNTRGPGPAVSISAVIPAGKTLTFPAGGSQFYLSVATAGVQIKPSGGPIGGAFVPYYAGTGQYVAGGFNLLEIYNSNPGDVIVQVVCSDAEFIDKRLIQNSIGTSTIIILDQAWVLFGGTQYAQQVADSSNTVIKDQVGNPWLALSRSGIGLQTSRVGQSLAIYPVWLTPFGINQPPSYANIVSIQGTSILQPWQTNFAGPFTATCDIAAGVTAEITLYEQYLCVKPGVQQLPSV